MLISMLQFKINEFITLKLEDKKTNLYINGELFEQCSYILLNKRADKLEELQAIDSVDELAELSIDEIAKTPSHIKEDDFEIEILDIPAHVRFLVHCSNLQAWAENNYETRLLHSNLSFPLLKKLTEVGDTKAKQKFKEEIIFRFFNGTKNIQKYLLQEGYMKLITIDEKYILFKLEEEENVIRELERLTGKEFNIDNEEFLYYQSLVLKEGKVKELNLVRCNITEIPRIIKRLKNLEVLRIYSNQLRQLPDWIGEISSLKILKILEELEELPDSIGHLKSLEILELHDTMIKTLPESFGNLYKLRKLDLSHNKLKNLPESFGNLKALEQLIVVNNELEILPKSFGNLTSLKELELSENKLITLPDSFGYLKSLRVVDLSNNQLKQIPELIGNLKSIKTITLNTNLLEYIPKSIGNLKTLISLDLSNNKIAKLPYSIGDLTLREFEDNLEYL